MNDYFDNKHGFDEYKPLAVELFKQVIELLNKHNLIHFLISGTLLGQVRHNDFIPWDDDIDLLTENLTSKLNIFKDTFEVMSKPQHTRLCFKNEGIVLDNHISKSWNKLGGTLRFPFVDLFSYITQNQTTIYFFGKQWDVSKFYPAQKVDFLGITANIPNVPDYFLKKNYGAEYMTKFKSSTYSHKTGKVHRQPKTISYDEWKALWNQ